MKRILVFALGLVAAIAALELALRIRVDPGGWPIRFDTGSALDAGRWVRHPFLPFAGKPHYRDAAARDASNAYGFHGGEFPKTKAPNDYFVVCLGETALDGAESTSAPWPRQLERRLQETYPTKHVVVFDLGSELATSAVSVVDLSLVGIHVLPDLVIAYHGCGEMAALGAEDFRADHSHVFANLKPVKTWNDWATRTPAWLRSSYVFALIAGGRKDFDSRDLRDLVTKPKRAGQDPLAGLDTTLRNLATLRSVTAGRGGETLFATYAFAAGNDPGRGLNDRLRAYFDANGFRYVDQDRLISTDAARATDGCNLTSAAHASIAGNFASRIERDGLLDLGRGMARSSTTVATEFRTSLSEP